jgi:cytochrome c oxidase cbb3-type subunit 4
MDFDLNILRAAVTVVSFAVFLGIVAWAWSKRRANDFDEAANLPFEQD